MNKNLRIELPSGGKVEWAVANGQFVLKSCPGGYTIFASDLSTASNDLIILADGLRDLAVLCKKFIAAMNQ